jgi:hypothetical protein
LSRHGVWHRCNKSFPLPKKELALALFKDKREVYLALTEAASAIAACRTFEQVESAAKEFLKLYYGRAQIIADCDRGVFEKKIAFRCALAKYLQEKPDQTPDVYFENFALDITDACRVHLDPRSMDAPKSNGSGGMSVTPSPQPQPPP